eukprot:TRINITY_DN769_c0_g1_i1.p1 TRINITY_DN769_c0_g1~~TRINITY_DN769_c0_g1_i1.p1  ORF type:complete len:209 (-),score=45.84 TRINITY_DN769_c0_g1_i1:272-898(-)
MKQVPEKFQLPLSNDLWSDFIDYHSDKGTIIDAFSFLASASETVFPPGREAWVKLLLAYGKVGSEDQLMVLQKFTNLGFQLTTQEWAMIMTPMGQAGKIDDLLYLYRSLEESATPPNDVIALIVLRSLIKAEKFDQVMEFFREIKIKKSAAFYGWILTALTSANRPKDFEEVATHALQSQYVEDLKGLIQRSRQKFRSPQQQKSNHKK